MIVSFNKIDSKLWNSFVNNHENTWVDAKSHWINFFSGWWENHSFAIINEEIECVFPLYHVKSVFFGNRLIGGALLDQSGPFFNNFSDECFEYIESLAKKLSVDRIELRRPPIPPKGYIMKEEYVDFAISSEVDVWKDMDKKLRNGIRKAKKVLTIKESFSENSVSKFYELHLKTMKFLGSPPLPKSFFMEFLKDDGFFLFAYREEKIISSVLITCFKDVAKYESSAYDPIFRNLQANSFLVYESIRMVFERNFKLFVFGRTLPKSSVYSFKKRWGAKEVSIPYYFKILKGTLSKDPRSSKLVFFSFIWKISPRRVVKLVGPIFRKMLAM